jgi:hypothetical protein
MKHYELNVQGSVEIDLNVEIVDGGWSLAEVMAAIRDGTAEGFNPLSELPEKSEDWQGKWTVGGQVIARYHIGCADYSAEVEGGYDEDDEEIDAEGNLIEATSSD